MLDLQHDLVAVARYHFAIDAIAAARLQINAEYADGVARHQCIANGIALALSLIHI